MSDTLPNINVTTTPQKLSDLSPTVTAGLACRIQSLSGRPVRYAIGATIDQSGWKLFTSSPEYGHEREFAAGESEIWLWTIDGNAVMNAELA